MGVAKRILPHTTNLRTYRLPDHTELPCEDGSFAQSFHEHPQSILLTDTIEPVLEQLHPDGQYCIGQDSGIYWNLDAVQTDTPERGAESPDWFYVPNVPPLLNGQVRRSYVLWYEPTPPRIVIEFVSRDGSEERDTTPYYGKFWIYERIIKPLFYAIYFVNPGTVEVYELVNGRFQLVAANANGHYSISPMGVALGIWRGVYKRMELPWLRWYNEQGLVLPTSQEEKERAIQEKALQAYTTARNLLPLLTDEHISYATGLPLDEVRRLRETT